MSTHVCVRENRTAVPGVVLLVFDVAAMAFCLVAITGYRRIRAQEPRTAAVPTASYDGRHIALTLLEEGAGGKWRVRSIASFDVAHAGPRFRPTIQWRPLQTAAAKSRSRTPFSHHSLLLKEGNVLIQVKTETALRDIDDPEALVVIDLRAKHAHGFSVRSIYRAAGIELRGNEEFHHIFLHRRDSASPALKWHMSWFSDVTPWVVNEAEETLYVPLLRLPLDRADYEAPLHDGPVVAVRYGLSTCKIVRLVNDRWMRAIAQAARNSSQWGLVYGRPFTKLGRDSTLSDWLVPRNGWPRSAFRGLPSLVAGISPKHCGTIACYHIGTRKRGPAAIVAHLWTNRSEAPAFSNVVPPRDARVFSLIIPGTGRERALARTFEVSRDGKKLRRVGDTRLFNRIAPLETWGLWGRYLVTFDEVDRIGYGPYAVAIYDLETEQAKAFGLSDFLTAAEIADFTCRISDRARLWRRAGDPNEYFLVVREDPERPGRVERWGVPTPSVSSRPAGGSRDRLPVLEIDLVKMKVRAIRSTDSDERQSRKTAGRLERQRRLSE